MRTIIEIFLAIIFSVVLGSGSFKIIDNKVKRESLMKVQKGLPSLESFTKKGRVPILVEKARTVLQDCFLSMRTPYEGQVRVAQSWKFYPLLASPRV